MSGWDEWNASDPELKALDGQVVGIILGLLGGLVAFAWMLIRG